MQLDFEKAFHSIEWNFMFEVLKKMNIGEQFIKFVKCCNTDIYSCIKNNGFTTNLFTLKRGVRQGCPLTFLLFILCVEIMGNQIRSNSTTKGLKIGNNEQKPYGWISHLRSRPGFTLRFHVNRSKTSLVNISNQHIGWISHLRSRPGLKPGFPNYEPCPNQVSADQVSNLVWVHYQMSSLDMVW